MSDCLLCGEKIVGRTRDCCTPNHTRIYKQFISTGLKTLDEYTRCECGDYILTNQLNKHLNQTHHYSDEQIDQWNVNHFKTCRMCGEPLVVGSIVHQEYCCLNHYQIYDKIRTGEIASRDDISECKICGEYATTNKMAIHTTQKHNMSAQQYYDQFNKVDGDGECKYCGKPVSFGRGILKGYRDFCYNTDCNVRFHNENNGRHIRAGVSKSISIKENPHTQNTNISYYLAKGMTVEESTLALKKRQSVTSLEAMVERYGIIGGTKRYNIRNRSFILSCRKLPTEIRSKIGGVKFSYKNGNYNHVSSESEIQLYCKICESVPATTQFKLLRDVNSPSLGNQSYYYYDISHGLRIIEFNEQLAHSNNRNTIKGKKDIDKLRIAESQGFKVKVVWESDYKANPAKVIEECIAFLKS